MGYGVLIRWSLKIAGEAGLAVLATRSRWAAWSRSPRGFRPGQKRRSHQSQDRSDKRRKQVEWTEPPKVQADPSSDGMSDSEGYPGTDQIHAQPAQAAPAYEMKCEAGSRCDQEAIHNAGQGHGWITPPPRHSSPS